MIFTNYAANVGKPKANIQGALVVSAPWDTFKSTASLEKPVNWLLYNRFLVNSLKSVIKK